MNHVKEQNSILRKHQTLQIIDHICMSIIYICLCSTILWYIYKNISDNNFLIDNLKVVNTTYFSKLANTCPISYNNIYNYEYDNKNYTYYNTTETISTKNVYCLLETNVSKLMSCKTELSNRSDILICLCTILILHSLSIILYNVIYLIQTKNVKPNTELSSIVISSI